MPRHPTGAKVLVQVAPWWPSPVLVGLGPAPLPPGGGSWQHRSCISTPDLGAHPLQPGPEGRQEEEVPFTAQDSRSCVLIFHFSLLIPQKFLINSVALPGRRAHLWSYQGRKATWPASSGFSPLHAQLGGQALHQPGTAGGGCQGLGQLRASCFTQKIMG